jgi:rubrerythrin
MNDPVYKAILSIEEFLAHAMVLEHESVEHYRELADSMEVHNNLEAAQLFDKLRAFGERHAQEVAELASGMSLPPIAPWEFKWNCPDVPESSCMEEAHYRMDSREVLELALHNELRGRDFYAHVAGSSPDADVRRLAEEMAREEDEHVGLLRALLARTPTDRTIQLEDLDPPNIPE